VPLSAFAACHRVVANSQHCSAVTTAAAYASRVAPHRPHGKHMLGGLAAACGARARSGASLSSAAAWRAACVNRRDNVAAAAHGSSNSAMRRIKRPHRGEISGRQARQKEGVARAYRGVAQCYVALCCWRQRKHMARKTSANPTASWRWAAARHHIADATLAIVTCCGKSLRQARACGKTSTGGGSCGGGHRMFIASCSS